MQYITLMSALFALALVPSEAHLYHKWLKKDNGLVLLEPVQPEPVRYSEPVPPIHVDPVQVEVVQVQKPHHFQAIWDFVRNKWVSHPIKQLFQKKSVVPIPAPVPDFKVWPHLGFSHYKKVQYYPVQVVVPPVHEIVVPPGEGHSTPAPPTHGPTTRPIVPVETYGLPSDDQSNHFQQELRPYPQDGPYAPSVSA